ncbi:hypothetical protein [Bacillus massiliigorillae]|uniref:hypothetical protein n=1 Tax=Bacillus massiliigorillae TaxID=1243664 RepID=UPI00039F08F0|nr:hypothetical protein [Bacillus massiliigorillae]
MTATFIIVIHLSTAPAIVIPPQPVIVISTSIITSIISAIIFMATVMIVIVIVLAG